MGEVYRARDTRLHRDVAIKVLPEAFAADADRLARFEREARVLASLTHPNIGAIHGLEESGDIRALVLELVDGPTLADRIAQGPMPLDEALPIARQIAEALEAAHEHGIIHRDLKPANIKVRPDGAVKVLVFGLAKAFGPASAFATATADKRSDVWAFGCVLYEMLAGRRAFAGEDVADTLAEVLKSDPDWRALPVTTPPAVHRLLRRCLTKDRKGRLPDIGSARLEIDEALNPTVGASC